MTDFRSWPWATFLVLFFALIGGVVTIVNESSLSFDRYLTAVLAAAAALSIGRGLSYKEGDGNFLNSIPWATVLVGVFAAVGGVVVLVGESSLSFDEYLTRVLAAAGVLGVGRGIAGFKKDHSLINTEPDDPTLSESLAVTPPYDLDLVEVYPEERPPEPN